MSYQSNLQQSSSKSSINIHNQQPSLTNASITSIGTSFKSFKFVYFENQMDFSNFVTSSYL